MRESPRFCPKCGKSNFCIPDNSFFGVETECIYCGWDWMDKKYHSNDGPKKIVDDCDPDIEYWASKM